MCGELGCLFNDDDLGEAGRVWEMWGCWLSARCLLLAMQQKCCRLIIHAYFGTACRQHPAHALTLLPGHPHVLSSISHMRLQAQMT